MAAAKKPASEPKGPSVLQAAAALMEVLDRVGGYSGKELEAAKQALREALAE